jgi:DNA-binding NarL/FixJ family response regulator
MSLEAMAGLASECRSLRILVVSRGSLEPKLEKLIPAGARGFLSKTATADQVESTVHSLLETRFDAPYKVILHSPEERTTVENLSPREAEVLEAVAKR